MEKVPSNSTVDKLRFIIFDRLNDIEGKNSELRSYPETKHRVGRFGAVMNLRRKNYCHVSINSIAEFHVEMNGIEIAPVYENATIPVSDYYDFVFRCNNGRRFLY